MKVRQEYNKEFCAKMIRLFQKKGIKFKQYKKTEEVPKEWSSILVEDNDYVEIHNRNFHISSRKSYQAYIAYLNPNIPISILDAFGKDYEHPDRIIIICQGDLSEKINKILKI